MRVVWPYAASSHLTCRRRHSRRRLDLFLILAVHVLALSAFILAFFLSRSDVTLSSSCRDPLDVLVGDALGDGEGISTSSSSSSSSSSCARTWGARSVSKVLVVVIDALRRDLATAATTTGTGTGTTQQHNNAQRRSSPKTPPPRLKSIDEVIENALYKNKGLATTRVRKFIADPPTTTVQRLKGIATGAVPAFADITKSFGGSAVTTDNVVAQCLSHGLRVRFFGDEAWGELFPSLLDANTSRPFPSLNVRDLHGVDRGVRSSLFPMLEDGDDDWDVAIAHYLGVDHVGHIHGVHSDAMKSKLEEMDDDLRRIFSHFVRMAQPGGSLEGGLLLVLGDHGQTDGGDHGGGTPPEVDAALFAAAVPSNKHAIMQKEEEEEKVVVDDDESMPQIDLAPTLALLLGIPVPYTSVGRVDRALWRLAGRTPYHAALRRNAWQVKRYLDTQMSAGALSASELASLREEYTNATSISGREAEAPLREYLANAAALVTAKWVAFDLPGMLASIAALLLSLEFAAMCAAGETNATTTTTTTMTILSLWAAGVSATSYVLFRGGVAISAALGACAMAARALADQMLTTTTTKFFDSVFRGCGDVSTAVPRGAGVVAAVVHAVALTSSSFIDEEAVVVEYLLQSVLLASFLLGESSKSRGWVAVALVAGWSSRALAEEASNSPLLVLVINCAAAIAGAICWHGWTLRISCLCACASWTFVHFGNDAVGRLLLPKVAYLCCLVGVVLDARRKHTNARWLARHLSVPIALVIGLRGAGGAASVASLFVFEMCIMQRGVASTVDATFLLQLAASRFFFQTDHACKFARLHLTTAAFVGFDGFSFVRCGAMLWMNTYGGFALASLLLCDDVVVVIPRLMTCLVTTAFLSIQRRHLFAFDRFAPKFMFEFCMLLTTDMFAWVGSLLSSRD
ncbi:GPI ethanolamine phosphate transferase 3 [Pycnococcus provasolii]